LSFKNPHFFNLFKVTCLVAHYGAWAWVPQWWLYPIFGFAITLTAHYYYTTNDLWKGVVTIVIIINIMLMVIDMFENRGKFRFFYYCWSVSLMVALAARAKMFGDIPYLHLAFYEYCIFNVIMFIVWLNELPKGTKDATFPWFFLPICILAVPLQVWWLRANLNEYRLWIYVAVSLITLNIMMFLIWGFVHSTWPWFIVPWAISGVGILAMWRFFKGGQYSTISDPNITPAASPYQGSMDASAPSVYAPTVYGNPSSPYATPQEFTPHQNL